ncbi:MAG: alpha-1,2-fucosyltransferase [Crocinitomicaceae bacterium]|nr:alpha-1,2-fucosyltransferase [Crocinitomicaceae bacterium]
MIYVKIHGGLGNQMFQYAAAKSLALKKNVKLGIDLGVFDQQLESQKYTQRKFELGDVFSLNGYEMIRAIDYNFIIGQERSIISKLKAKFLSTTSFFEKSLEFNSELFENSAASYIEGYFQSPKYFEDNWSELKEEFSFRLNPSEKSLEFENMLQNGKYIAMHVRRGDYVNKSHVNKIHGLCGIDYYEKGFKYLIDKGTIFNGIIVFSDDPKWCKKNLKFDLATSFVDWNAGNDSWQDMYLMSQCSAFVIANSSFSWWGAYLSQAKNKVVIAPKIWFADKEKNKQTSDLFPSSWILV